MLPIQTPEFPPALNPRAHIRTSPGALNPTPAHRITFSAGHYLSNPEQAATALMSGGTFGALSMLWGWLMSRGIGWSRWAASATTALLIVVFGWRAGVSWMAFAGGASEKLPAAILITLMGTASLAMLVFLLSALVRRTTAHT